MLLASFAASAQDGDVAPRPPPAPPFALEPATASPLSWRWTQSSHDLFSFEELTAVRALQAPAAKHALAYASQLRDLARLAPVQTFELGEGGERELSAWLGHLAVPADEPIVLSWDSATAVETHWSLFAWRWSAFWYPSSDDLEVFPLTGRWLLQAWHFGRFEWTDLATPGEPCE